MNTPDYFYFWLGSRLPHSLIGLWGRIVCSLGQLPRFSYFSLACYFKITFCMNNYRNMAKERAREADGYFRNGVIRLALRGPSDFG
jgi:hypothetical protein